MKMSLMDRKRMERCFNMPKKYALLRPTLDDPIEQQFKRSKELIAKLKYGNERIGTEEYWREFNAKTERFKLEAAQRDINYIVKLAIFIVEDAMKNRKISDDTIKEEINKVKQMGFKEGSNGFVWDYYETAVLEANDMVTMFIERHSEEVLDEFGKQKLEELKKEVDRFYSKPKEAIDIYRKQQEIIELLGKPVKKSWICRFFGHKFIKSEYSPFLDGRKICKRCNEVEE